MTSCSEHLLAHWPKVYPILDTAALDVARVSALELAEAMAAAGVRLVQFRHKGPFTRSVLRLAREVRAVFRSSGTGFVVNDRADMALVLQADGVHVGQQDLPPEDVRKLVGSGMLVGYSTHNAAQLEGASCPAADYLAIGPVFATSSKANPDPTVGLEGVAQARRLAAKPLVAIGGIGLGSAPDVLQAGADSVAMISALTLDSLPALMRLER